MGRYDHSSRSKVEDVKNISTAFLKKHNYFCGYNSGTITWTSNGFWGENRTSVGVDVTVGNSGNFVRIHYTQTDNRTEEKKDFDYTVQLTSTPCKLGGKRWWFICPLTTKDKYCGRRVGKLYKVGDYFGCRHCNNLTYESRNKDRNWSGAALCAILDNDTKIQEMKKQIKKKTYRGKPTRKYQKLLNFAQRTRLTNGDYQKIMKM